MINTSRIISLSALPMVGVLLIMLLLCNDVSAQKEFSVFQYTSKNGLPQNSVKSMIMDDNGFLWMTTEGGLVRFDGINFKVFNHVNTGIITTDRLRGIFKTSPGKLFTGDIHGGVYQINQSGISLPAKGEFKLNSKISYDKILPLGDDKYAIPSKTGLSIYNDTVQTDSILIPGYDILQYFIFNNDIFFITRNLKILRIDFTNGAITPCIFNNSYTFTPERIIWENGRPGLFIKDGSNLFSINITKDSNVFTTEWLCKELPSNCVTSSVYYDDNNHSLYVGTDSKGLFIFKEKYFKTLLYNKPEPRTNNTYYSQFALDSHTIVTNKNRMFSYNKIPTKSPLPFTFNVEGVIRDKHNNIWYNDKNRLVKYNLDSRTKTFIADAGDEYAYCFDEQGDTMWVGNTGSISYVYKDTMHIVARWSDRISLGPPYCIITVPGNKLWYCNGLGAYEMDKKTFKVDTIPVLKNQCVRTLTLHNNFIFIGTYGNGYYIYKDGKVASMPMDKNNFLSQVHSFVFDKNGYVWMTTNQGLFKTKQAALEHHFNDSTSHVPYLYYNEEDGINNSEFNGGCSPSSLVLKNGYVSAPTMDGMVWYKPGDVKDIKSSSPVVIDAVYFDEKPADAGQLQNIPSNIQNVRIDFATAYWGNKNNLAVEYKLSGYSNRWITLHSQPYNVQFANLHSGSYQLLIRKKGGLNDSDLVVKTVDIKVEKKYFETHWFKVLAAFCATLFVFAVANIYALGIKRRNKLLEEKVNERTIALGKANEQLQQSVTVKDKLISIISHDIVTPLRFISMVARQGSTTSDRIECEPMRTALLDIRNTSEKLRDNAQNILNWIKHQNHRINIVKSHVVVAALADEVIENLKEMADAKQTGLVNNVEPDDIIKTDKNVLSIILHNVLTNAIKFTANGSVTIDASHTREHYTITITDTGTGMNEEQLKSVQLSIDHKAVSVANPSSGASGNGLGYVIMSELIDLLDGEIIVQSTPGKGTSVLLKLVIANPVIA